MQLTVRDVAKLFKISGRTVYRWIKDGAIPAYKIHDQYRFNRAELLEWATSRKIGVSADIFREEEGGSVVLPRLVDSLKEGGIYYRVGGRDKESVLKAVVDILRLPEGMDQGFLLQVLIAREELGSTGIGDGIAIPHARNPIIMNVPFSMVALCFLEKPVDFGAFDGNPVHCLFTFISSTVRIHLHLLSKLAFFLKEERFKKLILGHASREEILAGMEHFETVLKNT